MASSTISVAVKFAGGDADLKKLAQNADEFRRKLEEGLSPAENLQKTLLKFRDCGTAISGVAEGFSGLYDVLNELTEAYAIQEQAETQVAETMRERMGATDDMIKSIYDLCSAQQALGVIGDEVQLAGVAQLASYMDNYEALKLLIPAMNNLVASTAGLDATSGDSTNAANLLGKAMQGNERVLKRLGIVMTANQAAMFANSDEMTRAQMLAELVAHKTGDMNQALAQTSSGKLKQMSNDFGDLAEKGGQSVKNIMPFFQMIAQFDSARKAITGVSTSLRSVWTSAGTAAGSLRGFNTTAAMTAVVSRGAAMAVRSFGVAIKAAIASTGIGLLITAIIEGISWVWSKFTEVSEKTKEEAEKAKAAEEAATQAARQRQETINSAAQARYAAYVEDMNRAKSFVGTAAQEKALLADINQKYAAKLGHMNKLSTAYQTLKRNAKEYLQQMINEATISQLTSEIAALQIEKMAEVRKQNSIRAEFNTLKPGDDINNPRKTKDYSKYSFYEVGLSQQYLMSKAISDTKQRTIDARTKELESLVKGMDSPGYTTATGASGSKTDKQKPKTAVEINEEKIKDLNDRLLKTPLNTEEYETLKNKLGECLVLRAKFNDLEAVNTRNAILSAGVTKENIDDVIRGYEAAIRLGEAGADVKLNEYRIMKETYDLGNVSYDRDVSKIATLHDLIEYQRQLNTLKQYEDEADVTKINALLEQIDARIKYLNELGVKKPEVAKTEKTKVDTSLETLTQGLEVDPFAGLAPAAELAMSELYAKMRGIKAILGGVLGEVNAEQRKQLEELGAAYEKFARRSALSLDTVSNTWSQLKGLHSAFSSLADGIRGTGTAWENFSNVLDGAIGVIQNAMTLTQTFSQIIEIFSGLTEVMTGKKAADAAVTAMQSEKAEEKAAADLISAGATAINTEATNTDTGARMANASAAAMQAHAWIPFVGAALGIAAAATMAAVVFSSPRKFAKGGIISGPTLGLMGEYSGARNNPEVVAPLDKLRTLITPAGNATGNVVFTIHGRELRGVLMKENKLISHT